MIPLCNHNQKREMRADNNGASASETPAWRRPCSAFEAHDRMSLLHSTPRISVSTAAWLIHEIIRYQV